MQVFSTVCVGRATSYANVASHTRGGKTCTSPTHHSTRIHPARRTFAKWIQFYDDEAVAAAFYRTVGAWALGSGGTTAHGGVYDMSIRARRGCQTGLVFSCRTQFLAFSSLELFLIDISNVNIHYEDRHFHHDRYCGLGPRRPYLPGQATSRQV